MRIVIPDGHPTNPGDLSWDRFLEFGEVDVYDRTPPELVAERIREADFVLVNKCRIGERELREAKDLKLICVLATGYDVVDIDAASEYGIPVCNIPAYSTESVAQMTMALLLEICQNVGLHSEAVHQGKWTECPDFCFWEKPLIELNGLTMGIFGCGRIGSAVARIAKSFGMRVLGYSRSPREGFPGERAADLETLLEQADVLSLHSPATAETVRTIRKETIARMKDGAILLNTARGSLVDEKDVAEALQSGKIYAYGADAVSPEPIRADSPLLTAPNCYITPHIAWAPAASRARLMDIAYENLRAFLDGSPMNVVNADRLKNRGKGRME